MVTKSPTTALQKKVDDFISKAPAELKIIFGTQYPGVKPDLSCALIVEDALRIYLRKFDPLQNTGKWGLGKLFGRSKEKHNFPKRFSKTIDTINTIRNNKVVHWGDSTAGITLLDLQKFLKEFLSWFFTKVVNLQIPKEISEIISLAEPKEKSTERSTEKKPSFKEREVKIVGGSSGSPKVVTLDSSPIKSRAKDSLPLKTFKTPYKFHLHIEGNSNFKRDYYESKDLNLNDFRGSISKSSLYDLSISFEFNSHDITFVSRGKVTPVELNGKKISPRMKPKLSLGTHSLKIGDYNYSISIKNY